MRDNVARPTQPTGSVLSMNGPGDYDVLLLDFGGVCLLNPVELHQKLTGLLGLPDDAFTWLGPIDPSTDELWRQMVAGNGVTEREYWAIRAEEVGKAAGREMSLTDYMTLLYEPPTPEIVRPEAIATSRSCLLYTSPSPRDRTRSRMPSSA